MYFLHLWLQQQQQLVLHPGSSQRRSCDPANAGVQAVLDPGQTRAVTLHPLILQMLQLLRLWWRSNITTSTTTTSLAAVAVASCDL